MCYFDEDVPTFAESIDLVLIPRYVSLFISEKQQKVNWIHLMFFIKIMIMVKKEQKGEKWALILPAAVVGIVFNAWAAESFGYGGILFSGIFISCLTLLGLYSEELKKDMLLMTIICTLAFGAFLLISGWGGHFTCEPDGYLMVYEYEGWYHWWPLLLPLLTVGIGSLFVSKK